MTESHANGQEEVNLNPPSLKARTYSAFESVRSILSEFSTFLAQFCEREKSINTILNTLLEGHASRVTEALSEHRYLNFGGEEYAHPALNVMRDLKLHDSIDMLQCLLNPIWAPFMIKDRSGNAYLDIDMEWIGDLLDQVMAKQSQEAGTVDTNSIWQLGYNSSGFRHLKPVDKIGHQITRCFFCLRLSAEKSISTLQPKLPFFVGCSSEFFHEFLSPVTQSETCSFVSLLVDAEAEVPDIPILRESMVESLRCIMRKFVSPNFIMSIEYSRPSNHNRYSGGGVVAVASDRFHALLRHGLKSDTTQSLLSTLEVYTNTRRKLEAFTVHTTTTKIPDHRIVLEKSDNSAFLYIDFEGKSVGDVLIRGSKFSAGTAVRLVPIYPIWHKLYTPTLDKLYSNYMEPREESIENAEDSRIVTDDEQHASSFRNCHRSLDVLEAEHDQWRIQLDRREYVLLNYARFMRDFLFNSYGIPIPQREGDTSPDGGITRDNMLQHIEIYFKDIVSNCVYASQTVDPIVYFNVGGMKLSVLRASIVRRFPDSQLATRISGRWTEQPGDVDKHGNILYNLPKKPFKALINYIRAYAMNATLAKLFVEEEHLDALKDMLNYLLIPVESVPICVVFGERNDDPHMTQLPIVWLMISMCYARALNLYKQHTLQ